MYLKVVRLKISDFVTKEFQSLVKNRFLMVFAIASVAFLIRLIVLSNALSLADPYSYAVQVLEILKTGSIPSQSILTYPGTPNIAPPLLPLIASGLSILGMQPLSAVFLVTVAFSALTSTPVFLCAEKLGGYWAGLIAGILFVFSYPSLYMLAWGGYPNAIGFFFLAWIIYFLINKQVKRRTLYLSLSLVALAYVHHFTFFIVMLWLMLYFIILAITERGNENKNLGIALAFTLTISAVWYLPRIPLIVSITQNSVGFSSFLDIFTAFYNTQVYDLVYILLIPFGLSQVKGKSQYVFGTLFLALIIYIVYSLQNMVMIGRVLYFLAIPITILGGVAISTLRERKSILMLFTILILIFILSLYNSAYAAVYFSNMGIKDKGTVKWIKRNLSQNDMILSESNELFYLAYYTERPVMAGGDPKFSFIPEHRQAIIDANAILSDPEGNYALIDKYNIKYIVIPKNPTMIAKLKQAGFLLVHEGVLQVWKV